MREERDVGSDDEPVRDEPAGKNSFLSGNVTLVLYSTLVVGLVLLAGYSLLESFSNDRTIARAAANEGVAELEPLGEIAEEDAAEAIAQMQGRQKLIELRKASEAEKERERRVRMRVDALLEAGDEVTRSIDAAEQEMEGWNRLQEELPTSEDGRRLVVDKNAVDAFVSLRDERRAGKAKLELLRSQTDDVIRSAKEAIAQDSEDGELGRYDPPEEVFETLDELLNETRSIEASYREPQGIIRGLIRAHPEPGELTLQQAIEKVNSERAQQRAAKLAARLNVVRAELDDELYEAQEKLERARTEVQLVQLDIETKKTADTANLQRLIAKAQSQQVKAELAPFTTPGYEVGGATNRTLEKKPYSMQFLRSIGAMEPTPWGLRLLHNVAHSRDSIRPRWHFQLKTAEDQVRVKKAQDLLRELELALVELGMLLP